MKPHILRYAVGRTSNRTGDVRAMSMAVDPVLPVSDRVIVCCGAAAEIDVSRSDAGVNYVSVNVRRVSPP